MPDLLRLYLLGGTRAVWQGAGTSQVVRVQPRPLHLLAYLALNWRRPCRREELQALFWPDRAPEQAANSLRQALWQLRHALPSDCLLLQADTVQWNPTTPPWTDTLAFEAALDADDLDAALALYAGPLLPDNYDEWAELERERLSLRYLHALETRAGRRYEARQWDAALADAETLLAADPLNETALRLAMGCHWALSRREAARRAYDVYRQRVRRELKTEPLAETTALYGRILRGESHPAQTLPALDAAALARASRLALLETLGAFRQGLEQAAAWAASATGSALAEALRWQATFHLRLGRLVESRAALTAALPLTSQAEQQAAILGQLATAEVGLGDYPAAEGHFGQALRVAAGEPAGRVRLLSGLGGLLGRMGRPVEARAVLEEAVHLARGLGDPAPLAVASGNLGILLIGQGEATAAEMALNEALAAARHADAHWLTAHITGHLGVLAQDRHDLEGAAELYQTARTLAETVGDRRAATLWTCNLGIVHYEQGRCTEALPLLREGQAQAASQGATSLEAGALIFGGACLVAHGQHADGLADIEAGLALARRIGDQERILMGYLQRGRALAALGCRDGAHIVLDEGLRQAEGRGLHRLADYLRAELHRLESRISD
jgi:DNA-binding SARP family transcriptional activator